MQVLAIDCTAKSVSAAIAEDGKILGETFLNIPLTHSETLIPIVEQLLINTKSALSDIDALAVTTGPGSFTGVRIGVSAIKGLSFAEEKKVFAYSALRAAALPFANISGLSCTVVALMDARCNQFYNAIFKVENGALTRVTEDRIIVLKDLENELNTLYNDDNVIFVGDGARLFYELSGEKIGSLAPENLIFQNASAIAINATGRSLDEAKSPKEIAPLYLRKSQAEREKEKANSTK